MNKIIILLIICVGIDDWTAEKVIIASNVTFKNLLELGARIKIDLDLMLMTILFFSSSQTHSSGDQGPERETHHRLKHPSAPEDTRVRREAHL